MPTATTVPKTKSSLDTAIVVSMFLAGTLVDVWSAPNAKTVHRTRVDLAMRYRLQTKLELTACDLS